MGTIEWRGCEREMLHMCVALRCQSRDNLITSTHQPNTEDTPVCMAGRSGSVSGLRGVLIVCTAPITLP
jgi:hypothetical protein